MIDADLPLTFTTRSYIWIFLPKPDPGGDRPTGFAVAGGNMD
jgi:hypothetical protein